MNLTLDNIIFSIQSGGGISAYWAGLISHLLCDPDMLPHCTFYEYSRANNNFFRKDLNIPTEKIIRSHKAIGSNIERYLSCKCRKTPSVFHSSYYRVANTSKHIKQVVTVHDFTYEYFYKGLTKYLHIWQKKKAIALADTIVCVSENTKKDLLFFYPEVAQKEINVIYNGVSDDYYPIEQAGNKQKRPCILYVGSRVFYKNFKFCVDWLSTLNDYILYIVGPALSEQEQKYLNIKLPARYIYYGMISNKRLNELFNEVICLLYPSSYEGFGIPVLEAMKAGCPVITLNNSSLPEVCGQAGIMIDRLDFDDFNIALNFISSNRATIVKNGIVHASIFSWEKCYNQTKAIYQNLGIFS